MKNTIRFISPLFILFACVAQKSFAVDEIFITAPPFDSSVTSNFSQPATPRGFDAMADSSTPGSYGATKKREAERAKACADAKRLAQIKRSECYVDAGDKRDKIVAKCPEDTEVVVGIPGVITATTTPRATCTQDAGDVMSTDKLRCESNYLKAIPLDCPK